MGRRQRPFPSFLHTAPTVRGVLRNVYFVLFIPAIPPPSSIIIIPIIITTPPSNTSFPSKSYEFDPSALALCSRSRAAGATDGQQNNHQHWDQDLPNSPQLSVAVIRDLQSLLSRLSEAEEEDGTDGGPEAGNGLSARPEALIRHIAARSDAMLRDIDGAERHLEELISDVVVLKRNLKKHKREKGRLRDAVADHEANRVRRDAQHGSERAAAAATIATLQARIGRQDTHLSELRQRLRNRTERDRSQRAFADATVYNLEASITDLKVSPSFCPSIILFSFLFLSLAAPTELRRPSETPSTPLSHTPSRTRLLAHVVCCPSVRTPARRRGAPSSVGR